MAVYCLCGLYCGVSLVNWLTPGTDFSESENRALQTFPEVNTEKVLSGKFSQEFESYANDQFLLRDGWVGLKTLTSLAMGKKDNGRVFFGRDGYLLEMDSVLNQQPAHPERAGAGGFYGLCPAAESRPEARGCHGADGDRRDDRKAAAAGGDLRSGAGH